MWIAVLCELCSHCSIAVWLIEMKLFTICQSLAVQGCSIWDSSFITRAFRKGCWCFEQSLALQSGVCAGVQHWNVPWGSLLATHPLMWSEAKQSWSVVSSCQTQELCPLLSWLGPTNTGMGLVGLCLMLGGHPAAQPREILHSAGLLQKGTSSLEMRSSSHEWVLPVLSCLCDN